MSFDGAERSVESPKAGLVVTLVGLTALTHNVDRLTSAPRTTQRRRRRQRCGIVTTGSTSWIMRHDVIDDVDVVSMPSQWRSECDVVATLSQQRQLDTRSEECRPGDKKLHMSYRVCRHSVRRSSPFAEQAAPQQCILQLLEQEAAYRHT